MPDVAHHSANQRTHQLLASTRLVAQNKESADDLMEQVKQVKADAEKLNADASQLAQQVEDAIAPIGNLVHDSVPVSDDEVRFCSHIDCA